VVDAVHNEVARDRILVVWNPVSLTVEDKSVEGMLEESPENESANERQNGLVEGGLCECHEPIGDRKGDDWGHPVWALGHPLQEWVVE